MAIPTQKDKDPRYAPYAGGGGALALPAGSVGPIQLENTAVTAGSYTNTSLTVDADGRITAASNGVVGDSTTQGVFASRPSAASDGDLYLATDGFVVSRDKGSGNGYSHFGPIYPLTAPVNANFSWNNQGSATVTDAGGAVTLVAPTNSGDSWRIREYVAPSTPYTITAVYSFTGFLLDAFGAVIGWRQSSDSKLALCGAIVQAAGAFVSSSKWTNTASFSASYAALPIGSVRGLLFFKIQDTGVNRICSYSVDGQTWTAFHSVSRTDFLTGDRVLFALNVNNTTYTSAMTLLSWNQIAS